MKEAERVAYEIIEKFRVHGEIEVSCRPLSVKIVAKQCALIHVEGIIKVIKELEVSDFMKYDLIEQWVEVKTIIENK